MSDFERALEAELLAAARRRSAARRRGLPTVFVAAVATAALALFALLPRGADPSGPVSAPLCSAQESLLRAGSCTSNPFSSLRQ